jgi:hemolysin activation/secretion protein
MSMRYALTRPATALTVVALVTAAQVARAQAVPGPIDPGQLGRELRQPPAPRVQPEVPRVAPTPPRAVEATGAAFRVDAVRVQGNTVLDADRLRPNYAALIGQSVHLADLETAADRMTAQYRAAGYVLSQVIVPEQTLADGTVTFQVIEGYVDSAVYQGDKVPDVLRNYVQKIIDTRPLTNAALERYLLLINDVPGISAHAALAPSPTNIGAAQLTLVVATQRAGGDIGIDNRLTRSLGHARAIGGAQLSNGLLAQEQFSARVIEGDSNRVTVGSLGWEQAWGSEGFKTSATFGAVRTRPNLALPQTSSSRSLDLTVSYPVLRSRDRNLYLRATGSALNSRADIADGGAPLFDDRVRALRIGVSADLADAWGGVNLVDLEASFGLDGTGSDLPSRAGANPHFHKLSLFASRLQPIAPRWSVLVAAQGQATGSTLYSSEQFGVGGENFLRGFDPSELIGDRGWAGKLELRFTPRDDVMVYAFYDRARVENADSAQSVSGGAKAASAGAGVRGSYRAVSAYLEYAQPLLRDVAAEGNRHGRLFGGLRYVF